MAYLTPQQYRERWGNGAGANRFGRAGGLLYPEAPTVTNGEPGEGILWNDPRYLEEYITPGSEGGGGSRAWRLRPETEALFMRNNEGAIDPNGSRWAQVGPAGVYDDRYIVDDPEFGLITDARNLKDTDTWLDDNLFTIVSLALGGFMAPAIAAGNAATGVSGLESAAIRGGYSLGRMGLQGLGSDGSPATGSGKDGSNGMSGIDRGRDLTAGTGSGGGFSDFLGSLGSLFGGGSDLSSFLGMLGLGRNAFGSGLGTAEGALDLGNRASALADPWGSSGRRQQFSDLMTPDYVNRLLSLDPEAIKNDPGYQFMLEQGTNAINVGDAAQGTLRSGNRLYELQDYGQGLANRFAQQRFQNNLNSLGVMGNLAGVNAGSPGAAAEALWQGGRNAANIRNGSLNGLFRGGGAGGNPLQGAGNLLGMIGQGGSALWNWLSGNGGNFDFSSIDFNNIDTSLLPYLNSNTDFNLGDFDIDFGDFSDFGDVDWGGLFG